MPNVIVLSGIALAVNGICQLKQYIVQNFLGKLASFWFPFLIFLQVLLREGSLHCHYS